MSSSLQRVVPQRLSDSGCFDVQGKTHMPGVNEYSVNSALWSDGADKNRAFAIPNGTTISVEPDGDFSFPVGSVLIKHFLHEQRYIETRLLMHFDNGWSGYTYRWRDDQSDADYIEEGAGVNINGFSYQIPPQSLCLVCHSAASYVGLGLEIPQLNFHYEFQNGAMSNYLDALTEQGYLSQPISGRQHDRLFALHDDSATLEQRARSYLHSNCSGCHRDDGSSPIMDLRFQTALSDMNVCNVSPSGSHFSIDNAQRLSPGNADASVLIERMKALDERRMPPIATDRVDEDAVAIISAWVNQISTCQ